MVLSESSNLAYILAGVVQVVPVDGDVSEGKATVTVEHLTGEATPVEKQAGDAIPGGARNLDGIMVVKVFDVFFSIRACQCFPGQDRIYATSTSTSTYGQVTILYRREGFFGLYLGLNLRYYHRQRRSGRILQWLES